MQRYLCAIVVAVATPTVLGIPTELGAIQYSGSYTQTLQFGQAQPTITQRAFGGREAGGRGQSATRSGQGIESDSSSRIESFSSLTLPVTGMDRIVMTLAGRSATLPQAGVTRAALVDAAAYGETLFVVRQPVAYRLTGTLSATLLSQTDGGVGWASAEISLITSAPPLRFTASSQGVGVVPIDQSGVMQPGIYTFTASAFARSRADSVTDGSDARASITAALVFTTIPSPPTVLTAILGGLLAARRRRLSPRAS